MKHFKTFEEHTNEAFMPKNVDNRYSSLVSQVLNILPIIEEKKSEWLKAFNEYSKCFSKIENLEYNFSKLSDEDKLKCEEIFKIDVKSLYNAVNDAPMYPGSEFEAKLQEIRALKKLIGGSSNMVINTIDELIEATRISKNIGFYYDQDDNFGSISYPKGRGSRSIIVIPKLHKRGLLLKIDDSHDLELIDELLKSLNKNGFVSEKFDDKTILIIKFQK